MQGALRSATFQQKTSRLVPRQKDLLACSRPASRSRSVAPRVAFTTRTFHSSGFFHKPDSSNSRASSSSTDSGSNSLAELNQLLASLARPPIRSSRSEDPVARATRKARFHALLDTFRSATVCSHEEQETLLEEHFDQLALDSLNLPAAPNAVLQGIASSMTEPQIDPKVAAGSSAPISADNPGKLINAAGLAQPFIDQITQQIEAQVSSGKPKPRLVGILSTPAPPSIAYAEWTKKACEAVGIDFQIWRTWDQAEGEDPPNWDEKRPGLEDDVEDLIIAANADESIDGIMVYFPVFGGRQDTYLSQIIKPSKDVEGLSFSFAWNLYHNVRWIAPSQLGGAPGSSAEGSILSDKERQEVNAALEGKSHDHTLGNDEAVPPGLVKGILPCTPLAIVKCLESMAVYDRSLPYGDRLRGKTITVVNRSEVVGRPLAALLANDGARVFSIDVGSIQEFSKRSHGGAEQEDREKAASEAVKAARKRNAESRLRPHHTVRLAALKDLESCVQASDVVISGVPSASFKIPTAYLNPGVVTINFSSEKNFEKDVRTKAALHLGAVGKMTICMLQRNLLRLCEIHSLLKDGKAR